MTAGFRSTFGFGQLDNLQQQLMQPTMAGTPGAQNDADAAQMVQLAHARRVPAAPPAAPAQAQQPGQPAPAPPSTVDQVNTGLPKLTPPTGSGDGGGLSSLFDDLFGGGDATAMLMG